MHREELQHIFYSAFLIFLAILGIGFIIPFLPDFSRRVGGEEFVGLIYSGFAFARLFAVPSSSMISDKIGRKPVIVLGLLVYSVTSFLYVHAYSFVSLFLVRLIHGLASSMIVPVAFAYALDYTQPKKEGFSSSLLGGSLLLGFGLGPAIGGLIGEKLGENYAFYLMGSMGLLSLVWVTTFMKDKRKSTVARKFRITDEIKQIFSSRVFIISLLIWFFIMFQRSVIISYFPLILENYGFGKAQIGSILTIYAILSSLLQYASGNFIDRFPDKFLPSFILGVVSYILLSVLYFRLNFFVISCVVASGILSSLVYPFIMAEAGAEAKRKEIVGGTIGFMDWAFSIGNILGPTTMGLLSSYTGLNGMFASLCVFGVLSFSTLYIIYRKWKV